MITSLQLSLKAPMDNVSIKNISDGCKLKICNSLNQVVYSEKLSAKRENNIHLNLLPGIYLLQLTSETNKAIEKLIIK